MKNIKEPEGTRYILTGMAMVLFLLAILYPVSADESITAYCYRDGRSLGNVTIFDTSNAATACNNMYYECRGKCIGCFHDFDYVDYVCVDTSGRTFLR